MTSESFFVHNDALKNSEGHPLVTSIFQMGQISCFIESSLLSLATCFWDHFNQSWRLKCTKPSPLRHSTYSFFFILDAVGFILDHYIPSPQGHKALESIRDVFYTSSQPHGLYEDTVIDSIISNTWRLLFQGH